MGNGDPNAGLVKQFEACRGQYLRKCKCDLTKEGGKMTVGKIFIRLVSTAIGRHLRSRPVWWPAERATDDSS